MALSNLLYTYDLGWGGNRAYSVTNAQLKERVIDVLTVLSPDEKPTLAVMGKDTAPGLYYDWSVGTLKATSTAGALEGSDFAAVAATGRTKLYNFTQHMETGFAVSNDTIQVAKQGGIIGVTDEWQKAAGEAMTEKMRDLNIRMWSLTTADAPSSGSSAVAALTGNLHYWARNSSSTAYGSAGSQWINQGGAFTSAVLYQLSEATFANGVVCDTLFMSHGVKMDMDATLLSFSTAAANAPIFRNNDVVSGNEFGPVVDVIRTSLGRYAVIVDRWIPQSSSTAATATAVTDNPAWYMARRADLKLAWWRAFKDYPLSPTGDRAHGYVRGSAGVKILNPHAIGGAYNVTT